MPGNFIHYIGSIFLGWGLGANDSANVFGTAVSSKLVKYRVAVLCTALFVILGAVLQGGSGVETLSKSLNKNTASTTEYTNKTYTKGKTNITIQKMEKYRGIEKAMIISLGAALSVFLMTLLKLPVSTSQAIVGAIIGVGIINNNVSLDGLGKVVVCWVTTPLGGMLFTIVFYYFFRYIFRKINLTIFQYDTVLRILLIISGSYGAYALGANNAANVAAVFVQSGTLTVKQACWFGGITIAIGAITYSKPVMQTVGHNIIKLDAFMAFVTVLSLAVTVYIYAIIGVPVSTTQAIVGAVLGFGFIKGTHTVNFGTIKNILIGWITTPVLGAVFAAIGYFTSNLYYLN